PLGASCYKDAPEGALIMKKKTVAINIGLLRGRVTNFAVVIVFAILILLSLSTAAIAQPSISRNKARAAIRAVLDAQAAAWNRGDVEAYMDGYDRSADTVFVSGDRVTRGWQTVLE